MSHIIEEYDSDQDGATHIDKKQKVYYATRPRSMINKDDHVRRLHESEHNRNENEFERQLRLEREEVERKKQQQQQQQLQQQQTQKQTRVDPDGTEYEYDPVVKGWFPRIADHKFLQYQSMNYEGNKNQQQQQHQQMKGDTFYLYNGKFFTWDLLNNKWLDADTPYIYSYIDYSTNMSYVWDQQSNQWKALTNQIPVPQPSSQTKSQSVESKDDGKSSGWFEVNDKRNTNVYVSGLPFDTTDDEFEQMMAKYGIIAKDADTGRLKCKLYRDDNGELKGDARCCYLMPESVDLCLQLLDQSVFKNHMIKVEKAKFEQKGTYDSTKQVKTKKNKHKEKKMLEKQRQKLLDWEERPEIVRQKYERVVVIQNIFDPLKPNNNYEKIKEDLKRDLEEYGTVRKIFTYEKNPYGIVTVGFKDVEEADTCCEYLNDRVWHNGRIIKCETWDGRTKYDLEETEEEQQRRLDEWHRYLELDDN